LQNVKQKQANDDKIHKRVTLYMTSNLDSNQLDRPARILTTAYLSAVCFLLPLAYYRLYFDITEAKHVFFMATSILYLLLLLVLYVLSVNRGQTKCRRLPDAAALCMLAFFTCTVVASFLSEYPQDVLLGQRNRYQGLLTVSVYTALVFALSRQAFDLRYAEAALAASGSIAGMLGVLNHFGVDPLGFMVNLSPADQGRFISTLGNADFYGSFLCLAFPVTFGWFCRERRLLGRFLSAGALFIVSLGSMVAGSDSTALGLIVAAFAFPPILMDEKRALQRFFTGWALFAFAALLFGAISPLLPSVTYLSYFAVLVSKPSVALIILLACGAASLALYKTAEEKWNPTRSRRRYLSALLLAVLLCIVMLVLLNTLLGDVSLGRAERYLRWSESWGTDRGKIWTYCVDLYASFNPVQKIFGAGSGVVFYADQANRVFQDAALDTAHNEYLQYLLTTGALGLAAYLLTLLSAVRSGLAANVHRSGVVRGFTIAVIAYAVQGAVNIAQPASTPLFFLMIGLLAGISQKKRYLRIDNRA
jgi:O-antigen ligase